LFADYLLTVQGDTDSAANRSRRREILHGLLAPLFDYKDDRRAFTPEQRRILWNSEEKRICPECSKPLTWATVSVDHILAHTKGGKTDLSNAPLLHVRCNSRRGAR
jgi:5-methylcytosine-specific restriction endonuclease McrA